MEGERSLNDSRSLIANSVRLADFAGRNQRNPAAIAASEEGSTLGSYVHIMFSIPEGI